MSIADNSFPLRNTQKTLDNLSERLPHNEIVRNPTHWAATDDALDSRSPDSLTAERPLPKRAPPGKPKIQLSLPRLADPHRSHAASDRRPITAQDVDSPEQRPHPHVRNPGEQNEIPPRTTVINGIEHRSTRSGRPGIAVVHPHALFRDCFVNCLKAAYEDHDVFAFARIHDWANSTERNALKPTVIVLFMDGAKASSVADLQFIDSAAVDVPIVVMSDIDDANHVMCALKGGARGYIPTSLPFNVAIEAVRLVEAGGTFIPASSLEFRHSKQETAARATDLLTERQMMVVGALCRGMANKRIAFELKMSEHTVKVHLRHIMRKLKAHNRTEVAVLTKDFFLS